MRRGCIALAGLLLAGTVLTAGGLAAEPSGSSLRPGSGDWEPLAFPRIDRHTRYSLVTIDGQPAFRAESECAASALAVGVDPSTLERTPILRWRWKVEKRLDIVDERSRAGDDFAARVYLLFRFESADASWFERSRRALGARLFGQELPGNVLNYVWSSRVERGSSWPNPYSDNARMLSLGPGDRTGWRAEQVDVVADYLREFGADPPELLGLAIMTDSDNSCSSATALFAGFRFEPRGGVAVTPEKAAP